MKRVQAAFLMDDIHAINPVKDTSFRLAVEAQKQGWQLHYIESNGLFFDGEVRALTHAIHVMDEVENYCKLSSPKNINVSDFDVLFLRSDPPFDANYLYRTQLLDLVKDEVLIVNNPTSVRSFNEKLFSLHFPQYLAETLVTRDISQLREFLYMHKKIVIKPLDSMGGNGVFVVDHRDPNVSVIFETQTEFGQKLMMAQKYLPEIKQGDKRILLIDGEPSPYTLARVPADGESRGNLNAGARGEVRPISKKEYQIGREIGDYCVGQGLFLVGLDMIGDKVTEINVTSPTCMREIENEKGLNLAESVLQSLQKRLNQEVRK